MYIPVSKEEYLVKVSNQTLKASTNSLLVFVLRDQFVFEILLN
jgi:hypothetical protein